MKSGSRWTMAHGEQILRRTTASSYTWRRRSAIGCAPSRSLQQLTARMEAAVGRFEAGGIDLGVDLGGSDVGMTEHHLHRA